MNRFSNDVNQEWRDEMNHRQNGHIIETLADKSTQGKTDEWDGEKANHRANHTDVDKVSCRFEQREYTRHSGGNSVLEAD